MPRIERVSIKVAGFDRRVVSEKLKKLEIEMLPADEKDAVRFKDLNGLVMDLKAGA